MGRHKLKGLVREWRVCLDHLVSVAPIRVQSSTAGQAADTVPPERF